MQKWLFISIFVLAGCYPQQGGGGGSATAPSDNRPPEVHGTNNQLGRDYLGDAMVAGARLHQALAVGRLDAARPAVRELRDRLAKAGQAGDLAHQREVNELDAAAIEIEGFMERGAPEAAHASAMLLTRLQASFDRQAAVPTAGGGGGGGGTPAPSPGPSYDELDPNQLLR